MKRSEAVLDGTDEAVIRARVRELVERMAPRKGVADATQLDLATDLGYHSLALLELAFALEEAFGLPPITEPLARGLRTSADVEAYVLGARGGS